MIDITVIIPFLGMLPGYTVELRQLSLFQEEKGRPFSSWQLLFVMIKMRLLLFFIIILFISCKTKENAKKIETKNMLPIIDFQGGKTEELPLKLSEIAESVRYIPLETVPKGLIGSISSMYASDSILVVEGSGKLSVFSPTGKFISCFPAAGRGPGEGFVRSFSADIWNEKIYVFENFSSKIQYFSYDGKWLGDVEQPLTNYDIMETYNLFSYRNKLFVIMPKQPVKDRSWFSYGFDVGTREIVYIYQNTYKVPEVYRNRRYDQVMTESAVFYQDYQDSLLLFRDSWNDTLYQTNDFKKITPRYILKFPDQMSYLTELRLTIRDREWRLRSVSGAGYYQLLETSRYFFSRRDQFIDKAQMSYYDKKEKIARSFATRKIENDLDGGPDFESYSYNLSHWIYKNKMYCLVWPSEWEKLQSRETEKSSRVREICATLAEDANPVLMVVTLKQN